MLIRRTNSVKNETLESLLSRLGKINYYDEKNWYNDLIKLPRETHLNFLYQEEYFSKLAEITTIDPVTLKSLTINRFIPLFYSPEEIMLLPSEVRNQTYAPRWDEKGRSLYLNGPQKVCLQCLSSNGCFLLPWLLRPITTCPVHHTLLVDICPECGQLLKVVNNKCNYCNSSLSFPFTNTGFVWDEISQTYTDVMWTILGCTSEKPTLDERHQLFAFNYLQPYQLFKYLLGVSTVLLEYYPLIVQLENLELYKWESVKRRKNLRELRAKEVHRIQLSTFQLLLNWPNNWYATLERIVEIEIGFRNNNKDTPKRHSFPYKLRKYFWGIEWGWLWKAIGDFVKGNEKTLYWAYFIEKFDRDFYNSTPWFPSVSLPPANPFPNILQLEDSLNLGITSTPTEKDLVGLLDAAKFLGITKGVCVSLTEQGWLEAEQKYIYGKKVKWKFRISKLKKSVEKVVGQLPKLNPPFNNTETTFLIDAVRLLNHASIGYSDLFKAIQGARIQAFQTEENLGFEGVWFFREDLDAYKKEKMDGGRSLITIYQVIKILGCSRDTLRHLYYSKLLLPHDKKSDDDKKWKYRPEDVLSFKELYITSREAAQIIGCSESLVSRWSKRGWLPIVSGPNIDGSHHYRYHKASLQKWRRERLNSSEVKMILGISQRTFENWVSKGYLRPLDDICIHPYWFWRNEVLQLVKPS